MEVTLSDNAPCMVRRLGLYELKDHIEPSLSGPFVLQEKVASSVVKRAIILNEEWDEPPKKPTSSEAAKEGTPAWFEWQEYRLYQAVVFYETQERPESQARYLYDVALYVFGTCISSEDRVRVVTAEDYQKVYFAAIVPELTIQHLQIIAHTTYKATFEDIPILEALLENNERGSGSYDVLMVWENRTMLEAGMTENEWSDLLITERARKVLAYKLDDWMSSLQWEKDRKKRRG